MEMPIFISHYTKNSPYAEEVKNLILSLQKQNLEYDIEAINTLGSWRANSNYCIQQIQKMLKKHYPKPVLRLDADAIVQRYPSLFTDKNFNPDIAAVVWYTFRKRGELLGGTMYFANNRRTHDIVDQWEQCNIETPLKRNSDLLEKVLQQTNPTFFDEGNKPTWPKDKNIFKGSITFEKLPLSYCAIFDHMKHQCPHPVIEHFQASRRFKKIMNEQK